MVTCDLEGRVLRVAAAPEALAAEVSVIVGWRFRAFIPRRDADRLSIAAAGLTPSGPPVAVITRLPFEEPMRPVRLLAWRSSKGEFIATYRWSRKKKKKK